jgi:hypothetical protein
VTSGAAANFLASRTEGASISRIDLGRQKAFGRRMKFSWREKCGMPFTRNALKAGSARSIAQPSRA